MSDAPHERLAAAFRKRVLAGDLPPAGHNLTAASVGVSAARLIRLFESQLMSRHLDYAARLFDLDGDPELARDALGRRPSPQGLRLTATRARDLDLDARRDAVARLGPLRDLDPPEDRRHDRSQHTEYPEHAHQPHRDVFVDPAQ